MKPFDVFTAVLMASLWGMGFVLAKFGLGQFPPILLMALRFTAAALVLVWFAPMPRREMPRILLVALVVGAISYSLTFYGFMQVDASLGTILIQLESPLAVLRAADWRGWLIVLYLGFGMTALGYTLWYRLISRYRVNQVSPFLLLIPVVAVIGSMILLGERPTLQTLLGGVVVLAGVALSTWGRDPAPTAVAPITD